MEREEFVDEVVLAPSERVVLDVLFDRAGELTLEHRTPDRVYPLAAIEVSDERAEPSFADVFDVLRTNDEMVATRERVSPYFEAEPDKRLAFIAEMDLGAPEGDGPVTYTCNIVVYQQLVMVCPVARASAYCSMVGAGVDDRAVALGRPHVHLGDEGERLVRLGSRGSGAIRSRSATMSALVRRRSNCSSSDGSARSSLTLIAASG